MQLASVPLGVRRGQVIEFDDPRGLGTVLSDEGVTYPFHCANIADGSRHVEVGARLVWRVVPGRLGRWEAADLRPEGDR